MLVAQAEPAMICSSRFSDLRTAVNHPILFPELFLLQTIPSLWVILHIKDGFYPFPLI